MGHGHRNMFRLTGLPGWVRFGQSSGWGAMPPGAQYLSQTGQLPQAVDYFSHQVPPQLQPSPAPTSDTQPQQDIQTSQPIPIQQMPPAPVQQPQFSKEWEIQVLENQLAFLEDQIRQIKERMEQLKKL